MLTSKRIVADLSKERENNAIIIAMAYPQEAVRTTEAFYSKLLPYVGIGKKGWIKAGHACMIVVKLGSEEFEYFDFGRYISPIGYARARGANNDPETKVDIPARWDGDKLSNVEELLAWLYEHPEKTRGEGDLYASISENVNYESVKEYIDAVQGDGVLPYGPFVSDGTNCVRFVSDAILNGSLDKKIWRRVSNLYFFTPSVITNVDAANSYEHYYVATEGSVYKSKRSIKAVQLEIMFDRGKGYENVSESYVGKLEEPVALKKDPSWRWLPAMGYGVWYDIRPEESNDAGSGSLSAYGKSLIAQYSAQGEQMWQATFLAEPNLDPELMQILLNSDYTIDYPSHYGVITLLVNGKKVSLRRFQA